MNKPIQMVFTQPLGKRKLDSGAFTVTPTHWSERLAWKFLRWVGAVNHYFTEEMLVREVIIHPDKTVALLVAEADSQLKAVGYKPTIVYMGPEEFIRAQRLYPQQYLQPFPPFSFKAEAERWDPMARREILGFEVKIIPHMKGILVV